MTGQAVLREIKKHELQRQIESAAARTASVQDVVECTCDLVDHDVDAGRFSEIEHGSLVLRLVNALREYVGEHVEADEPECVARARDTIRKYDLARARLGEGTAFDWDGE
jgi:uncharacterized protein with PIN domain